MNLRTIIAPVYPPRATRYWSVCENELLTQRHVACSADHETVLDREGYFTIAVSDAADRPVNATPAQGISWLPWGPFVDGLLIYRHMLPNAAFAPAATRPPSSPPAPPTSGASAGLRFLKAYRA